MYSIPISWKTPSIFKETDLVRSHSYFRLLQLMSQNFDRIYTTIDSVCGVALYSQMFVNFNSEMSEDNSSSHKVANSGPEGNKKLVKAKSGMAMWFHVVLPTRTTIHLSTAMMIRTSQTHMKATTTNVTCILSHGIWQLSRCIFK